MSTDNRNIADLPAFTPPPHYSVQHFFLSIPLTFFFLPTLIIIMSAKNFLKLTFFFINKGIKIYKNLTEEIKDLWDNKIIELFPLLYELFSEMLRLIDRTLETLFGQRFGLSFFRFLLLHWFKFVLFLTQLFLKCVQHSLNIIGSIGFKILSITKNCYAIVFVLVGKATKVVLNQNFSKTVITKLLIYYQLWSWSLIQPYENTISPYIAEFKRGWVLKSSFYPQIRRGMSYQTSRDIGSLGKLFGSIYSIISNILVYFTKE
ncbi:hypothetical protein M0812_26645 [Anaeramoeba flamelloides]|uniref:Uncharacterized protein n=1 Tax=Anaeramoeba flamelloides TaxID=1746091 RepID=A0AAV7YB51_9EUKA|nr:hypothetical protein M0812_26645 [Anaeramoeba flamelloides]